MAEGVTVLGAVDQLLSNLPGGQEIHQPAEQAHKAQLVDEGIVEPPVFILQAEDDCRTTEEQGEYAVTLEIFRVASRAP